MLTMIHAYPGFVAALPTVSTKIKRILLKLCSYLKVIQVEKRLQRAPYVFKK